MMYIYLALWKKKKIFSFAKEFLVRERVRFRVTVGVRGWVWIWVRVKNK